MKTKKKSLFAWFGRTVAVGLVPLMMFGCAASSDSDSKDSVVNQDPPTFSTDPSEGDVVTGTSVLKITFNESVTGVSTTSVVLKNNAGTPLATTASSNGNTYSFNPSTDLVTGNYSLTVGEGGAIKDGDGQGATATTVEFRVEDALTTIAANLNADLVAAGISSTDATNIVANAPTSTVAATLTNDLMNVIPAAITGGLAYIGATGSSTAKSTLVTSVIESANGATSLTTSGRTITRVDATAFNELLSRISTALTNAASGGVVSATEFGNLVSAASAAISNAGADADQVAALQSTLSAEVNTDLAASSLDSSFTTAANSTSGGQAGSTYSLTNGADTFTGGSGDDTFVGSVVAGNDTWTVGDALDGSGGADTLTIIQSNAISSPTGATVTNIETASATSAGSVTLTTTSWTGLTSLTTSNTGDTSDTTITASGTTNVVAASGGAVTVDGGQNITVTATDNDNADTNNITVGGTTEPAGTVSVTSTSESTGVTQGTIAVTGGTTVNVTQAPGNAVNTNSTAGAVTVTGGASTTAATVTDARAATGTATVVGRVNGAVTVNDKNRASGTAAGTIATVSLNSFAAATIDSSAISTVNLTGTATSLGISRGALTATPTANTLTINIDNMTMTGDITDSEAAADDGFTTVNIVTNTDDSSIRDLILADATAINFTGSNKFTATGTGSTLGTTTSTITSGAGGLSLGEAILTGQTFTGGAGADTISLTGSMTTAVTTGAGDDTITSDGVVGTGGSVDAGAGTDTIVMTSDQAEVADNSATFNTKFTNFEELSLSDELDASTTVDLLGINSVSRVTLAAGGGHATSAVFSNLPSGGTVKQTGDGTGFQVNVTGAAFNASDTVNLALSKTGGVLATGTVTLPNVETVSINTADAASAGSAAVIHTITLTATAATGVTVSGNNGLNITNTGNTAITSFNASGVIANGTADTAANLAVTFLSANTTATAAVAITGGEGNDTLTGVAALDTIIGGAGADTIAGGTGIDTLTGGAGADEFDFADGDAGTSGTEQITDFAASATASSQDVLDFDTTIPLAAATNTDVTAQVTGAAQVLATVANGFITIGGTDAALVDTVGELSAIYGVLDNSSDQIGAVAMGGNTYIINDDAGTVQDVLKLTGLTGMTAVNTTGGATTIKIK